MKDENYSKWYFDSEMMKAFENEKLPPIRWISYKDKKGRDCIQFISDNEYEILLKLSREQL